MIYASGGAAEIKKLRPLFADFTREVHDLGAFGNGSKMKYIANLLVAIHNVASAEALVLGMKAGLPPQLIYAGTEQGGLKGKEIVLIFEKASTRTRWFEVACMSRARTSPISTRQDRRSAPRNQSRTRPGCLGDVRRDRFAAYSQEAVEDLAKYAGVPVFNGLTDEYHPTQMVADVMTMRENSDKPLHDIKYAYVGDTRSNMGHSLMIVGCLMGMDVRICGPKSLWPSDEYVTIARDLEAKYGGKLTITDDPKAGRGRRFRPYRRLGFDGRGEGGLGGAHQAAEALSGRHEADEGDRQSAASSCTACRPSTTSKPRSAETSTSNSA